MIRIALAVSVQEFGAMVGADLRTVSAWERGEAVPSPLHVQRIRAAHRTFTGSSNSANVT
jgi:DNA-binding transcriptional regulator YiaG